MKSNFLIFSFSHRGLTQSTNKRVKRIACFYFTNLRTYILYILFVSIFTIKYILPFPIHINNIHLLISKICKPPDLFPSPRRLAEFQERFLRCGIRTARTAFRLIDTWQSASPPHPHPCRLHVPIFLLSYSVRRSLCLRRQPVDPVAFIERHHLLSYLSVRDHYLSDLFDSAPDRAAQRSSFPFLRSPSSKRTALPESTPTGDLLSVSLGSLIVCRLSIL
jgi:hypothetical protein